MPEEYGSVPHAGFGLGIECLCKWMLNREAVGQTSARRPKLMFGLDHIRDAISFPRTINRVYP